jgi:ABC-2 type transport system ATP-binding protein
MDQAAAEAAPPLLEARDVRIAVDDVVAVERLSCATRGDRVLCAGDARPLFAAVTGVPLLARGRREPDEPPGEARVVAGSLALAGRDVAHGAHRAIAGAAPLDPPLPPRWTAEAYVAWSARLGGATTRPARALAATALERVGLLASRSRPLSALALPERRALVMAAAIATSPAVVVIEDPLSGLQGGAAGFVMAAIASATQGRRALLSIGRADAAGPGGALVRGATDLLVLSGGEVSFEGAPDALVQGFRVYALLVRKRADALRDALATRGIELRGGPSRFTVALPAGVSTRDIVAAVVQAQAAVVELSPIL